MVDMVNYGKLVAISIVRYGLWMSMLDIFIIDVLFPWVD